MKATHKTLDVLRLGLHSLTMHKGRSVLTALGVIFGVWSVIAMLAINEGASYQAQLYLRELGSNNILIESVKPTSDESKASEASRGVLHYGLTHKDVTTLRDNVPGLLQCVSIRRTPKSAMVDDRVVPITAVATEPTYGQVGAIEMVAGRFISTADVLRTKAHCVITESLSRRLFRYRDAMGQIVRLDNEPFVVIGILSHLPKSLIGTAGEGGNFAIIPLSTDQKRYGEFIIQMRQGGATFEKIEVSQLILKMDGDAAVMSGAEVARSLLDRLHEDDDYEVGVPLELLAQQKKQRRLWNVMFIGIASVSLLVGGIGIMNIMLASVTERTREIGIRRALGAKKVDVVVQFLVESVALTAAGGAIGIGIGLAIPYLIEFALGLKTIISPLTVVLPFTMAIVVGLASGLYPASRAAKLDPITALRHE